MSEVIFSPNKMIDGQAVFHNPELKHMKMTIQEPFISAGKKFNWGYRSPGLGFNLRIIEFVLKHKLTMIVFVKSVKKSYFIRNDVLLEFLKTHNTDYKIRNTVLKIVPFELFIPIILDHK